MKKKTLVMLGAGGHARLLGAILTVEGYRKIVFLDDNPSKGEIVLNGVSYPISGPVQAEVIERLAREGADKFIVGLGSVNADGCILRDRFYQLASAHLVPINAVARSSFAFGNLGVGVYVGFFAIIMPGAVIGNNSMINTRALVEHDCRVGWSSHIAPGAVLLGGVQVGNRVHVGAGALVKQGVKIGNDATIGMGAVVLKDVAFGETVVGNPARVLARCSQPA